MLLPELSVQLCDQPKLEAAPSFWMCSLLVFQFASHLQQVLTTLQALLNFSRSGWKSHIRVANDVTIACQCTNVVEVFKIYYL